MSKSAWLVGLMLTLSSASLAQTQPAKVIDRIVAQVNDDIITLADVNREMAGLREQLAAKYTGTQLEDEVKKAQKQILEQLIEEKLFLQKANDLGMGSGIDSQVSAFIEQKRKENNIKDMDEFERALEQQGMTLNGYREDIRKHMIINELIGYFVDSRVTILSEEVERFYKDHLKDFSSPEEVTLSEILVPDTSADGQAQNLANDYRNRVLRGESFAAVAGQFSKGPTANKGGSIGTYQVGKLNPKIAEVVASVKEGDMSQVVHLEEGYAVYRVDTRKASVIRPLDEVRNDIKEFLFQQKRQPEFDRFVAQLKEDAYVQIFEELGIGK